MSKTFINKVLWLDNIIRCSITRLHCSTLFQQQTLPVLRLWIIMDIKTLLNSLHEEVSCSVCMTTFTDPKQLPCLHSFCVHCLNGILRTSGRHDIITCPECRRESRVPSSGNLKDLPTNFRINSLLDVLAIQECSITGVKCGNCDKKSSQVCIASSVVHSGVTTVLPRTA